MPRVRVALESTVIAHGLPRPVNLASARACEAAVRASGAEPATVALVDGSVRIGLTDAELESLATRLDVAKVSLQNLAAVCASGAWGATTVASTAHLAARHGILVFATGGIGGVHREAERTFDVSADLTALATTPLVTVCAGAKSILDLPRTLELLETLGVPVIGWQTDEFPGFYTRTTGLGVTVTAESEKDVARIASAHWALGCRSAVLVVVPCPVSAAIPGVEIDGYVAEALAAAAESGIRGAAVTPFLLARVADSSGGRALAANLALLENNARIAGRIAVAFDQSQERPGGRGRRGPTESTESQRTQRRDFS
jgi:pseudouridine-5'-phosphate glycosidase